MSKQEKLDKLLEEYMLEHNTGEVVLTLQWNMGTDEAIKLLEQRDGREIISLDQEDNSKDSTPIYAYK